MCLYGVIAICLHLIHFRGTPVTMDANLRLQVLEYLSKKGYNRTEAMLRLESANQDVDGKPISARVEDSGGLKYGKALGKTSTKLGFYHN